MTSRSSGSAREVAASLMGEPSARTLGLLKRLERAIAARPDDPRPRVRKGKALERMLKFSEALKCYDQALAAAPKDLPALLAKASLLERSSRGGQAVKVLDLAIVAGGDGAKLSFEQGRILHELDRLRAAVPYYERCLSLKRHHRKAVVNLAAALIGLKRYSEAVALCDAKLKQVPDWPDLLCSRGIAWMELREYGKAMADYRRALEASPGNQVVFYNLACWWMKNGSPKKALAFLGKAAKGNPHLAEQALKDRTLSGLEDTARFWRIVMTGMYLDDATLWWLRKKFKIETL
jgi:tetratricopeptide (TPR) repeat protein